MEYTNSLPQDNNEQSNENEKVYRKKMRRGGWKYMQNKEKREKQESECM